jgi:hypothetical protein
MRNDPTLTKVDVWLPLPRTQADPGQPDPDDAMGDDTRGNTVPHGEAPENIERGRVERVRMLSLDGLSDPRRDRVDLDDDYGILHDLSSLGETFQASFPGNDPSSTEAELGIQQNLVFGLEGRFPLLPRISM